MRERVVTREEIAEVSDEAMFADGYDDCLIGYVERIGMGPVPLYDRQRVIKKIIDGGSTEEEAEEFFQFNIIGAYVGDGTPAFATILTQGERE